MSGGDASSGRPTLPTLPPSRPEGGDGTAGGAGPFGPVVTRSYPKGPAPLALFGARTPVHDPRRCEGEGACVEACPTEALAIEGRGRGATLRLDYGRCVFCRACVDACPSGAMTASTAFELATTRREDLRLEHRAGLPVAAGARSRAAMEQAIARDVQRLFHGSLAVREVDAGSCNGCEVEVAALTWPTYDLERLGVHLVASPRHADALLVTGPVTANMRLALEKTFRATPGPKIVLAVGACGISGGPFRGSPEVLGGVAPVLPVQVYIPGCPPRPEALLYGLWLALGQVTQRLRQGELPTLPPGGERPPGGPTGTSKR